MTILLLNISFSTVNIVTDLLSAWLVIFGHESVLKTSSTLDTHLHSISTNNTLFALSN